MILAAITRLFIPWWQAWMLGKPLLRFFLLSGDLTNHSRLALVPKEVYQKTGPRLSAVHMAPQTIVNERWKWDASIVEFREKGLPSTDMVIRHLSISLSVGWWASVVWWETNGIQFLGYLLVK